ncbi:hypothetical protein AgCh_034051 [Apium graveolens]
MGRAKSNMEFIKNEKLRCSSFQQKNNTLKKKVFELTTLCDIKAAMIVYGPQNDTPQPHPLEPEIWPDQNRDEVLELINKYKGQSAEDRKSKTSLLSDFFNERIRNAQKALTKQRKDNVQSKYPTWYSRFDKLKEEDLRKSVVFLDNVIGNAKAKLERMKANNITRAYEVQQPQHQQQHQQHQQQQQEQQDMMLSKKRKMNSDVGNQASKYLKLDPYQKISDPVRVSIPMLLPTHQQQRPQFVDQNWNPMMVKFSNEYAGGTSNVVHNAPMSKAVCNYRTMAGTPESISHVNNFARAPSNYYGEGRQPITQHVMEYRPMTQLSNSHQMVLHPVTQGSNSQQMAIHPLTQSSNSHQMVLHPVTQGSNSQQMAIHPVTQSSNSYQMVLYSVTQGSNSQQMAIHPMTQSSNSHQMVLHPVTQGSNSQQMAIHPITQSSNSHQMVLHPMTQGSTSQQMRDKEDVENFGFSNQDVRNVIRDIRRRVLDSGDAECGLLLLRELQENGFGNFFYRVNVDDENRVWGLVWVDPRSMNAYKNFGDVVTFDSTYRTDRDETEASYKWVLRTWLEAVDNKPPRIIITDQDIALRNAIAEVMPMPQKKHTYCTWHISRWEQLVEKYDLEDHAWLNDMYAIRTQWIGAYTKQHFSTGMTTTSRSESTYSFFDEYVQSSTGVIDREKRYLEDAFADEERSKRTHEAKTQEDYQHDPIFDPPTSETKGRKKTRRFKSGIETATSKIKPLKCSYCGEIGAEHDRRNCPLRDN